MFYEITEKYLLNHPHLIGEYDVASYFELPAEDLYKLQFLSAEELTDSLSDILKRMAIYMYTTRIEYTLDTEERMSLNYGARPHWDFISHTFNPPQRGERAEVWYNRHFKHSLTFMPTIKPNTEFSLKFERILAKVINLNNRKSKLYGIINKPFVSRKKKKQAHKLIDCIDNILCTNSVGFYGIIVYAYTLYLEKSSNSLYFYQILGLKFQNRE